MTTELGRQGVRQLCRAAMLAAFIACWCAPTAAQRITRWVDDHGRLHFTTSPPPPGIEYEMLDLPLTRAAAPRPGDVPAEVTEEAPPAPPENRGAEIVFAGKKTEAVGPSARAFRGRVKNVGGEPASAVSIRISVFEDGQGNDCLQDTFAVEPPSLGPGETGTYSAVLESPCFFGTPRIDLTPRWAQVQAR